MSELDRVVRLVIGAADMAVINGNHSTHAAATRAAVKASFECALANGLIRMVPDEEWPEWIAMDPPYQLPQGSKGKS